MLRFATLTALFLPVALARAGAAADPSPATGISSSLLDVEELWSTRTPPLDEPVLALAWLDDTRLAVLSRTSVSVYRMERLRQERLARRELPEPLAPVRHPGGLLLGGDDALWVLTSAMPRAVLYALDGDQLIERAQADALPWPQVSGGLRYRDGTNLLESPAGLLLTPTVEGLAVDPSGTLRFVSPPGGSPTGVSAGPTLEPLGRGIVAISTAAPPGSPDAVVILERTADQLRVRGRLPVSGSVRALAGRRVRQEARLAVALENDSAQTVVLLLGLRRRSW